MSTTTPARRKKQTPVRTQPVAVTKVDPGVWRAACKIAAPRFIEVVSPTEVVVRNQPQR